jgi:hypothetical protein
VPARQGDERARFEAALADADPRPQIHVQHYLLWPPIVADYPYNYVDAPNMAAAVAASGRVRLVLSGHYHAGLPPVRHGEVWYATAPALAEAPHRYWLYELTPDGLAWAEHTVEE